MNQFLPALGIAAVVGVSILASAVPSASAEPPRNPGESRTSNPQELGQIAWRRGFDAAADAARQSGRPLLVLFDEVPGCATCTGFGRTVLSHPLVVEAAESLFVPVAVYNNVKGDDERTLKAFREPAWNNPVVRILASDRKDLAPRVDGDYSPAGISGAMVTALEKLKAPVPAYLRLLADQCTGRAHAGRAAFTVHCFWEGEVAFGAIPGVLSTRAGFHGGAEAVEVEYDPRRLSYTRLLELTRAMTCVSRVVARSDGQLRIARASGVAQVTRSDVSLRPDTEPKYHLARTPLRHVPMIDVQAARVNAAVARNENPRAYLSPRQIELLVIIERHPKLAWPNAIDAPDIVSAWADARQVARRAEKLRP